VPHKIAKSLLPDEEKVNSFQRIVNAQIEEMRLHDAHMKNVAKEPKNYHPYPAPMSHPDVMNSIVKEGNDYNVSFEIFDDETLENKKNKLQKIVMDEAAVIQNKIFPMRKRNYTAIEQNKILSIDEKDRTPQQKKKLAELNKKAEFISLIIEHQAKMEAAIEDLTEATIGKWKPEPFPEINL